MNEYRELITNITQLGVGGVLAAFIFFFYRKDQAAHAEQTKSDRDAFAEALKENTAAISAFKVVLEHNTEAQRNLAENCRAVRFVQQHENRSQRMDPTDFPTHTGHEVRHPPQG
jgi:hypothetical protein